MNKKVRSFWQCSKSVLTLQIGEAAVNTLAETREAFQNSIKRASR